MGSITCPKRTGKNIKLHSDMYCKQGRKGESMPLFSFTVVLIACIGFSVIIGNIASICSNYFPWLLSWRAYYVVKSKRMQKLLISGQVNKNRDTRTAPEDRNKMAFVGFVMWGANLIFTVVTWSISIFSIVMEFFLSNAEAEALAERVDPFLLCFLNMKYFCFISIMPILYLLDYGIGKYFYFKRPWWTTQMK